jgi:hypothetical protein
VQVHDLLEVPRRSVVRVQILQRLEHCGAAAVDRLLPERVIEVRKDPAHPADPEHEQDDDDAQAHKAPRDTTSWLARRLVLRRL